MNMLVARRTVRPNITRSLPFSIHSFTSSAKANLASTQPLPEDAEEATDEEVSVLKKLRAINASDRSVVLA